MGNPQQFSNGKWRHPFRRLLKKNYHQIRMDRDHKVARQVHAMRHGTDKPKPDTKIPFWRYSTSKLIQFISYCLNKKHVTFIATENHWFENRSIIDDEFKEHNRIELVTQLRDPLDRFISNYLYSLRGGAYVESDKVQKLNIIDRLKEFHESTIRSKFDATNDWNMYVRVLTTQFDSNHTVTEDDLAMALVELEKFDLVTVLEMSDAAALWEAKYGMIIKHKNVDQKY